MAKKVWKTIKPLFSDKNNVNEKITLIDEGCITSEDPQIAEIMNNIQGFNAENNSTQYGDHISSILGKITRAS